MTGDAVAAMIQRRAAAAGCTAAQVDLLGGHSLRSGFVTEAFRAGADAHYAADRPQRPQDSRDLCSARHRPSEMLHTCHGSVPSSSPPAPGGSELCSRRGSSEVRRSW